MVLSNRPQSTFWVHVRLLEDVGLVPACWESLILGCDDKALGFCLEASCVSHLWVLSWSTSACFTRCGYLPWCAFDSHFGPELLATLVFGLGLCSAGIGGVRLILCSWYCGHSQFPNELHWLPVDGVQGFPVVRVFDKVEESVLRLLEVFIKTDSGWLVGKLQLYEPSTSLRMGRYNLSTSDLRWCISYMVRNFLVFVSSLVSSCNVQFMMLRQQVTTGTAKVLMASSLFAEFSSDLRLIIIIILFMLKKCPFGRHYVRCSDYIIMPKIVQA